MPQHTLLERHATELFGRHALPYGVFGPPGGGGERRIGVRVGDQVLDLAAAARVAGEAGLAELLAHPVLNPLMAAGRPVWDELRAAVVRWLSAPELHEAVAPLLTPLDAVRLHLPFEVADYVDFYASEHHATTVGRLFRPGAEALPPNWKHLPIGYHGRSGSVVVSGTDVVRPNGQYVAVGDAVPRFGACARLDFEAEVGFVAGVPSEPGVPVPQQAFAEHVFGICLVNDWSARDIQAWEYVPLGPFLGKSFATTASAWVLPLAALTAARVEPPRRDAPLLPYLDDSALPVGGLDLRLEVELNGHVIARPPFASMYWTAAQQLAHMTVNGAVLRTGDLFASGTVSGPGADERGCLLEMTSAGREPMKLPDGSVRAFLEDGDVVTVRAWAPGPEGTKVGLGEVTGRVLPAPAG